MQLTPQIIQQLWREEPHMQAAFKEHVPRKMDQASFWRKYGEYLVQKVTSVWLTIKHQVLAGSCGSIISSATQAGSGWLWAQVRRVPCAKAPHSCINQSATQASPGLTYGANTCAKGSFHVPA